MIINFTRLFFLLLLPSMCFSHDFWIEAKGDASIGNTISFSARAGEMWPGKQLVKKEGMLSYFKLFYGNEEAGQDLNRRNDTHVFGHYKIKNDSTQIALLETNDHYLSLSAEEFNKYLQEEGLKEALEFRARHNMLNNNSNELFYRIAKSYVKIANDGNFNRTFDLPLEISLITNPLNYEMGSPFLVKITSDGKPLGNKQIKAQEKTSGKVHITSTNSDGIAEIKLDKKGLWLFSTVVVKRIYSEDAEWRSTWASITLNI